MIWVPAAGFEGWYEVSDEGQVRSLPRSFVNKRGHLVTFPSKMLSQRINTDGYFQVNLCKQGEKTTIRVHRLVLESFEGVDERLVCHNDGNKLNNKRNNLRFDNHSGNFADYRKHGGRSDFRAVKRSDGKTFQSIAEAAESVDASHSSISAVCHGRRKTAKGFTWEFIK